MGTTPDLEASLLEQSEVLDKKQRKIFEIKRTCERDTNEMDEQTLNYENLSAQVKELSEELQEKEEERDAHITLLNLNNKEIKKLKDKFQRSLKDKEEQIDRLKTKLETKKQEISECLSIIEELQGNLEKKTEEYELLSEQVSQLESERDKMKNEFRTMRTEHEQTIQREAARAQGAEDYAREIKVCECL